MEAMYATTAAGSWTDGLIEADPTLVGVVVGALLIAAAVYLVARLRDHRRDKDGRRG